jgi:hypothetical protein
VGISDGSAVFDSLSGKRGLRKNTANLALEVARKGEADARRTLEGLLRQSYLQTVAARQALATQKEAQETLGRLADLIRARYQHGAISEVDVLKVETEKLTADQQVERSERDLDAAKAQLAFMLGARGRVPVFEVDPSFPATSFPRLSRVRPWIPSWTLRASSAPTWPARNQPRPRRGLRAFQPAPAFPGHRNVGGGERAGQRFRAPSIPRPSALASP